MKTPLIAFFCVLSMGLVGLGMLLADALDRFEKDRDTRDVTIWQYKGDAIVVLDHRHRRMCVPVTEIKGRISDYYLRRTRDGANIEKRFRMTVEPCADLMKRNGLPPLGVGPEYYPSQDFWSAMGDAADSYREVKP